MSLRVSVVITNHNYAALVSEALASLRAQTRPADEIIVVDDGSTDDSLVRLHAACDGQADTRLIAQANCGQLSALIAGTRAASGDIVCYLDADDAYEPHYLATLLPHYARDQEIDYVYCNLRYVGSRDGLWSDDCRDHDHGITVLETMYGDRWVGAPTSALSMRRAVALHALEVPDALVGDWRTRADDVLIYGSSLVGASKRWLGEPLVRYRVHGANAWFGQPLSRVRKLQHEWRVRQLFGHYRQLRGIDRQTLDFVRHEFRTKPKPRPEELRQALRLAWQAPQGLTRRLERLGQILGHYWHSRRA